MLYALPSDVLLDQYAVKPTGSDTAVLLHYTHFASHLIQNVMSDV